MVEIKSKDNMVHRRLQEMKAIVEEFREFLGENSLKIRTVDNYVFDVKYFLEWLEKLGEDLSLSRLHPVQMERYVRELKEEYSVPTVNRKISSLNRFGEWAHDRKHMRSFKKMEMIKSDKKIDGPAVDYLTQNQRKEFENHLRNSKELRDLALYKLILATGATPDEIKALKVKDFPSGSATIVIGTGKKQRRLPLKPEESLIIERHVRAENPKRDPEGFVFEGAGKGKPLSTPSVYKAFKKHSDHMSFSVTPHILRNTFVLLLLKRGVPFVKIHEYIGGGTLEKTMRYQKLFQTINDI